MCRVIRKNKDGKWTTFWLAQSREDGSLDMREIDPRDPALAQELGGKQRAGKLRLENDDQVWVVITIGEDVHEHVERVFRDAVSLAQEHMIPHQPYRETG